jgi:transmembrane sensor
MSHRIDHATSAIRMDAQEWVVRLDGPLQASEREEFVQWLRRSPLHVREYLKAEAAWQVMMQAAVRDTADADALSRQPDASAGKVVDLLAAMAERGGGVQIAPHGGTTRPGHGARHGWRGRGRRWAARAAAVAAIVLLAAGGRWLMQPVDGQMYATAVGETRRISLQDGSTVELNTDSAVQVRYRRGYRDIVLLRGEAFVDVAKDPRRPFRVMAEGIGARAVGTAFNVRRDNRRLEVTVTEGRVEVEPVETASTNWQRLAGDLHVMLPGAGGDGAPGRVALVSSGQRLSVDLRSKSIDAGAVSHADLARWVGWRHGRLHFDDERLDAIVAELNRYNSRQIRLQSPTLASRRISGNFDPNRPQQLLRFLAMHGDVVVHVNPDGDSEVAPISTEGKKIRR